MIKRKYLDDVDN